MFEWIRRRGATGDVRTLKESAAREMARGRWAKALPLLEALAEREPRELQHRIRLGDCLRHLGRPEEAARHWLHAASGWSATQHWERALGACRLVLSVYPDEPDVLRQIEALEARRRQLRSAPARPPERAPQPAFESWRPTRYTHAIELEGWEEDRGEVETPRQAVQMPERPLMRPSRPVMPPPVLQPVALSAESDHEVDAMPESVFENLHASFSSSGPATTPGQVAAHEESPPAPRPLPPMCECRKCPTCVRRRHLWRIIHTLDDEPVVAHVTE